MAKQRKACLTPFQTVAIPSKNISGFASSILSPAKKTVWVPSLLQQASEAISPLPERIVWCYSQWQPAYTKMLVAMPYIEFVKGIPTALE